MTQEFRRFVLPPKYLADRRAEAKRILDDLDQPQELRRLAWRFLLDNGLYDRVDQPSDVA